MNSYYNAVNNVYKERANNIVIGLTGRTGSGCSTAAKILETKNFNRLNLPNPKPYDFVDSEERKYSIYYGFMKENWKRFITIEASSIILSFVLEQSYEDFYLYITNLKNSEKNKGFRIGGEAELEKKLSGISFLFTKDEYTLNNENVRQITANKEQTEKYYKYYTATIKENKKLFSNVLSGFSCYESSKNSFYKNNEKKSHLYTYLMQLFGNNLRSSGLPFHSNFNEQCFYIISERIANIIEIVNAYNGYKNDNSTRVCIDAIRNPYEAYYFKDRYSSFYLLSVNTDDEERIRRLAHLDTDELNSLDEMEYPFSYEDGKIFFQQSIEECLQISDVHLYNPLSANNRYELLTKNLVKYIALMIHPGLITPTSIERCMQMAYNAKLNSGCLSRQVGAVVTDDKYYIKAVGWNDVPEGQISCSLRCVRNYFNQNDEQSFSCFEYQDKEFIDALNKINLSIDKLDKQIVKGRSFPYCFKDIYNGICNKGNQVHTRSLHAEENAFLQIAKFGGQGVKNGKLFVTASPCELCSKKSYQLGIRDIYYIDPYPGIAASHILKFGTSSLNPQLHLFYGAIGNAYVNLYAQRFAIKDELQLMSGIDFKEKSKRKRDIQRLGFGDVKYNNMSICLCFNNRHEVDFYQDVELTAKVNGLKELQKSMSWSGSTYGKTEKNDDGQYEIIDSVTIDGISYYTIKPNKTLNSGDTFKYSLKTSVKDEMEVMNPKLSCSIMAHTDVLLLTVKFHKGEFKKETIKNTFLRIYADNKNSIEYSSQEIEIFEKDNYYIISKKIKTPLYKYSYAIEWDF